MPQRPLAWGRTAPGHSWWPTKRAERFFVRAGNFSQWRLVVDSLRRTDVAFPEEGVPFAVKLPLDDLEGQAMVFNDLAQIAHVRRRDLAAPPPAAGKAKTEQGAIAPVFQAVVGGSDYDCVRQPHLM